MSMGGSMNAMMSMGGSMNAMMSMGGSMNAMMSMGGARGAMMSMGGAMNPMMSMGGAMNPMMSMGGAMGANRSDYSHYYYNVPSSTTITYEGILNSAYFKLNSKEEKKTINMEISLSSVKNPISNEKEVWLGTLFKSKYDGQKINKLIDLSIALDISGSMSVVELLWLKRP